MARTRWPSDPGTPASAKTGQIRPAALVGARNWDPADKPVAGQPRRRRPDRRSGRVPDSDTTPEPPQDPGSKTVCRNRFPNPPCRLRAHELSNAGIADGAQINHYGVLFRG